MNNPVLECRQLAKSYFDADATIEVLRGINLTVQAGEMVAIVGNSGSGKSTFLHLLGGLDRPTAGQVLINGKDVNQLSEAAKCQLRNQALGFVYQFHHLLPEFTALENVAMPLLIRGDEPAQIDAAAKHLLEQVGLGHRMSHRLGELSGGERQRVAIARALANQPLCILADEPSGNLDPSNADRVLQLFFQLQATHRASVVIVTHDLAIARQAHRTLRIEQGKLVDA